MTMHTPTRDQGAKRHALLHAAIEPLARELRLVDAAELVATIARGQFANLDDLVASSLELGFEPHAFTFGWGAEALMSWDAPPVIALDMEFSRRGITAFFVLRISGAHHAVDIRRIMLANAGGDPAANTHAFAAALDEARLQASDKATCSE